jgi:succinyl-CoA synthetase alpha subunit
VGCALLVITAGVTTDPVLGDGLAAVACHGVRMVGPNCLGLVNANPAVRLPATFGPAATAGHVGVAAQSGGAAIALIAELSCLGLAVSTVLSTGDATGVNGYDMLLRWAEDGTTAAPFLYAGVAAPTPAVRPAGALTELCRRRGPQRARGRRARQALDA